MRIVRWAVGSGVAVACAAAAAGVVRGSDAREVVLLVTGAVGGLGAAALLAEGLVSAPAERVTVGTRFYPNLIDPEAVRRARASGPGGAGLVLASFGAVLLAMAAAVALVAWAVGYPPTNPSPWLF